MTSVLAVIPARYESSRFPGKALAPLWGKPLIQHVWERAREVRGVDELVVATDDERIARTARSFGAVVEMTSPDCASGTDRVAEVARRRPGATLVINLQGDEPELDAGAVAALVAGMQADPRIRMGTLAHVEADAASLRVPDVVKVIVDADGFALYFSRENVEPGSNGESVLRHVGVYGFRREFLLEFASWPPGVRERAERLEQLRATERGVKIKVFPGSRPAVGVDTPQELAALERRGPRGA